MNIETIQIRRRMAPDYKRGPGRNDPFTEDNLLRLIQNQSESYVLKRRVISFDDALDHAEAVTVAWAAEDADLLRIEAEKKASLVVKGIHNEMPNLPTLPPIVFPQGTHKQQVAFAREQWKTAIQWRKDNDEKMKDYVAECADLYKSFRGVTD